MDRRCRWERIRTVMRRVHSALPTTPLALALILLAASAAPVFADDLTGFLDLTYADFDAQDQSLGLPVVTTGTEAFNRRLFFNFSRRAFPRVRFWVGGTFDRTDVTRRLDGLATDTDEWRIRPFAGIARSTRLWTIQLTWTRDQRRFETSGLESVDTIRDTVLGSANYTPESEYRPLARLAISSSYDRDSQKQLADSTLNTADVGVRHQVNRKLRWNYRGSLNLTDNQISATETQTTTHRGDVTYSDEFWNRRLTLTGAYSINYNEFLVKSGIGSEIDLPIFALEGFAGRDDTPLLGTLPPEPRLNDDDLVTPTQVNLGLPPLGGDERPWAMGLSFNQETTVNALFVWVDRELTPEVAASFVWQVYSSDNNLDWTPREVISSALFDDFLRRFSLRFSGIRAQFVKLVVRPLGLDVPDAAQFPDIFVTELDAAERVQAPSGRSESNRTTQRVLIYTRARLLAKRELYYEGNLEAGRASGRDTRYNMLHGIYFRHPFSPEADLSTRVAWQETGTGTVRDRDLIYAATLSVRPVPRVSYSLSLTGNNPDFQTEPNSDRINLFFFGNATLYEGVDVQLGAGRTWIANPYGPTVSSDRIEFGSRIQPRRDLIFVLNYTDAVSETVAADPSVFQDLFTRLARVSATYIPVPSVYLYAEYRKEWRTAQVPLTFLRWNVNWSPFGQGSLRVGINYDETRSDPNSETQTIFSPFLRWQINGRSYFQLTYSDQTYESALRRSDSERYSASLRWGF